MRFKELLQKSEKKGQAKPIVSPGFLRIPIY